MDDGQATEVKIYDQNIANALPLASDINTPQSDR